MRVATDAKKEGRANSAEIRSGSDLVIEACAAGVHRMFDLVEESPVDCTAKYVPAPADDGGDGNKLLLVGSSCCRKVPKLPCNASTPYEKPAGLTNLSDALFYSFTKDLQLSLNGHWISYWQPLLLCLLIIIAASASSAIYLAFPAVYLIIFDAISLFCAIVLAVGNHCQFKDLCAEIELRTEEWEPLFESEGFSVECIVDKSCWRPTELYVQIKRPPPARNYNRHLEQEVKYMVFFARLFARRSNTCRTLLTSKALSKGIYVKPPALQDLSDAVFLDLMKDMDKKVRAFAVKKRNIGCFLFFVLELTMFLLWTPVIIFLPVTTGLVLLFILLDQFVIDHVLFPRSGISKHIKKWMPRLEAHGFSLEYVVDQPYWYSWKEGLIHIRRHGFDV